MADEWFVDQDMFARRYRRECSFFLGGGRDTDIDGVDVCTGQQVIEALNRRDPFGVWPRSFVRCQSGGPDTAISLAFVDLSIASAMIPAIIPVPTMPNLS